VIRGGTRTAQLPPNLLAWSVSLVTTGSVRPIHRCRLRPALIEQWPLHQWSTSGLATVPFLLLAEHPKKQELMQVLAVHCALTSAPPMNATMFDAPQDEQAGPPKTKGITNK